MPLDDAARVGVASADRFIAGLRRTRAEAEASAARLRDAKVEISFSDDGHRTPRRRIIVPQLDWDEFDRQVRLLWAADVERFQKNPQTSIFFAPPDSPQWIGGGTLRPRDWIALAMVMGSQITAGDLMR